MIENIVVNGCSFTELNDDYTSWSEYVAKEYNIKNYINLGMGGAGNFYIADSTQNYLEFTQLDPEKTLVLIMWSGPLRLDARVAKEWWNLLESQAYPFKAQLNYFDQAQGIDEENYYVFGGIGGGAFTDNSLVKDIFMWADKIIDPTIMCQRSLTYMTNFENYLQKHQYHYRFASYLNYWKSNDLTQFGEISVKDYAQQTAVYKNFDFSNWIFINDKQDCFGEYAIENQQLDKTRHPTGNCHQAFAENIIIPNLKGLFK